MDPKIGEDLLAKNKSHNSFDRYAIAALKILPGSIWPSVVEHLPQDIYLLCDYQQRASIVQSNKCLPSTIPTGSMLSRNSYSGDGYYMELVENSTQVMKRYEELVNEHYKEPVIGNVTVSVLKTLTSDESEL